MKFQRQLALDFDKQRMIITPMLRLVFSITSLVDTSDFFEVRFHFLIFSFTGLINSSYIGTLLPILMSS